jgi:LPS sulfotransferase NodH
MTPYFVCATPRSGSTLLCEALGATGVAGHPAEYFEALRGTNLPRQPQEYFAHLPEDIEALLPTSAQEPSPELARARTYAEYLDWVREQGTTPNGAFAAKLMWGYFGELIARLREIPRYQRAGTLETLEAAFPNARYVQVLRRGKVEQAVSLWTAIQTQTWRAGAGGDRGRPEPVYHRGALEHLVRHLADHERAWSAFFAGVGVEPLVIVYEELVADWEPTLRATLAYVGIEEAERVALPQPPLQRQADERSRAWIDRYLVEVGGAAEADVAG